MTDDQDAAHVPEPPELGDGPTTEEAKNVAAALSEDELPDAADLPTDVRDGEAGTDDNQ